MLARELRNKEDVLGFRRLTELTSRRDSAVMSSFWVAKVTCVNKEGPQRPKLLLAAEQPSSQRRGFCGRLSRTFCEVLWITLDLVNILWITLDLEVGFVFPEKEPEIPTTLCKKNKRLFNHDLEPHSFPLLLFQRVTFRRPDTFMATVDSTLFPQRAKCKPSTWTYE